MKTKTEAAENGKRSRNVYSSALARTAVKFFRDVQRRNQKDRVAQPENRV